MKITDFTLIAVLMTSPAIAIDYEEFGVPIELSKKSAALYEDYIKKQKNVSDQELRDQPDITQHPLNKVSDLLAYSIGLSNFYGYLKMTDMQDKYAGFVDTIPGLKDKIREEGLTMIEAEHYADLAQRAVEISRGGPDNMPQIDPEIRSKNQKLVTQLDNKREEIGQFYRTLK